MASELSQLQVLFKCWKLIFAKQIVGRWYPCHSDRAVCMCNFGTELTGGFVGTLQDAQRLEAYSKSLCNTPEAVASLCTKVKVRL